jgi:hypothetical protein
MLGGFGQWLQGIIGGILKSGRDVFDAIRSASGISERITGRTPDATGLRSIAEKEQFVQIAQGQPDALAVQDWARTRGGEAPNAVYGKIPHSQIRQAEYAFDQPYQVRMHFAKFDNEGNIVSDKWVTLYESRNKSPGELMDDADDYWATAGEKYGYDKSAFEFEVWEDPQHPDWTP